MPARFHPVTHAGANEWRQKNQKNLQKLVLSLGAGYVFVLCALIPGDGQHDRQPGQDESQHPILDRPQSGLRFGFQLQAHIAERYTGCVIGNAADIFIGRSVKSVGCWNCCGYGQPDSGLPAESFECFDCVGHFLSDRQTIIYIGDQSVAAHRF